MLVCLFALVARICICIPMQSQLPSAAKNPADSCRFIVSALLTKVTDNSQPDSLKRSTPRRSLHPLVPHVATHMAAVFGSDAPATAYSYAYSLRQRVQVHVPAPSTNAALVENTKPTQAIIMPPKAISSARRKPAIIPTQMPPRPTVIPHGIITPPPSSPAAGLIGKSSPEREDADDREPGAARIHEFKSSPDRENGNEFATAGAICEIDVALQDPPHLVRLLRDYLDESLPQYQQKPLALVGLDPPKFEQLCKDLAPELERSRLRLDYDANQGTWILQRASGAHEAGAAGWGHMVDILKTMDMPRTAYRRMIWTGGQPGTYHHIPHASYSP